MSTYLADAADNLTVDGPSAVQHLATPPSVGYSDAGHAFVFQHAKDLTTQVTNFLAG